VKEKNGADLDGDRNGGWESKKKAAFSRVGSEVGEKKKAKGKRRLGEWGRRREIGPVPHSNLQRTVFIVGVTNMGKKKTEKRRTEQGARRGREAPYKGTTCRPSSRKNQQGVAESVIHE